MKWCSWIIYIETIERDKLFSNSDRCYENIAYGKGEEKFWFLVLYQISWNSSLLQLSTLLFLSFLSYFLILRFSNSTF